MKNVSSILLILLGLALFNSCKNQEESHATYIKNHGKTMGTTYNLTYDSAIDWQDQVDSILIDINNSVSTYIPTSTISIINNDSLGTTSEKQIVYSFPNDPHFINNFNQSLKIHGTTHGYFDPTIMPLVNYWGFGYKKKQAVTKQDTQLILKLKEKVGLEHWTIATHNDSFTIKKRPQTELDFSAIAKGYAVDYISQFLEKKKIQNYLVEIGGEVYASGKNANGKKWTLGLSKPETSARVNEYQALVNLNDKGMASSGNYRNYYNVDGQTYGHEINPKTGFPEVNQLLGTSVITESCASADAYATAFMVLGLQKSQELLTTLPEVSASLFYRAEDGSVKTIDVNGFATFIKEK